MPSAGWTRPSRGLLPARAAVGFSPGGAGARCEYAISGVVEDRIVRGAVDRTFVDETGTRWIIDYKTSDHQGGDLAFFLDEEQRRYRPQLERYARLLAPLGQPVRLGLYFPLLDAWREWDPGLIE